MKTALCRIVPCFGRTGRQLLVIQSVLRTAPVMHGVIKDLTKDQMQAVVAYLESMAVRGDRTNRTYSDASRPNRQPLP